MKRIFLFLILILSLFLGACTGKDNNDSIGIAQGTGDGLHTPDEVDQTLFAQLSKAYDLFANHSQELWTSSYRFDLDQAMYVRTDAENNLLHAYLFNYEGADQLPIAKLIETGFDNLGDVYYFSEIPNKTKAENIPYFDFTFPVGNEEIFMLKYSDFDEYMPLDSFEWILYVTHEAMHRYQMLHWQDSFGFANEDYPLETENIALIYLEHKLLLQALQAEDDNARDLAIKQFLVVREDRNQKWPETIPVDNEQERGEGMPRYLEYRLGKISGTDDPLSNSITNELEMALTPMEGLVRDGLSFGRFYSTGAALGYLLDELGLDWKTRVESGETPFDILSTHYSLDDTKDFIEAAMNEYGYSELLATATRAAEMVLAEPKSDFQGGGDQIIIESIIKPYQSASPSITPSYLPEGYSILGMFSYSVSEIEIPPLVSVYSPAGEDVVVVDLGNISNQDMEIRISRSMFDGSLSDYLNSLAIGMPPLEELTIHGYQAQGFVLSQGDGYSSLIFLTTGTELIQIEGPIKLEEASSIMESLFQ